MNRSEKAKNWIMRLAAVLLCLVLVTTWATGKMYARYTTRVTVSDQARVAKFNITETGDLTHEIKIDNMKPGETRDFTVEVTSSSEVAVYYTIAVENVYKNLPLEFTMRNAAGEKIEKATIAPNETDAKTYTLRVTWPKEKADPACAGKVDLLAITLTAAQVD